MKYSFETIMRDMAALRGEPSWLSLPEEETLPGGENGALSDTRRALRLQVERKALEVIKAHPGIHDETLSIGGATEACGTYSCRLALPSDYLRIAALRMPDWPAALSTVEEDTLRTQLGALMPERMAPPESPLLRLERRPEGLSLMIQGTRCPGGVPATALYVPRPRWRPDGTISLPPLLYPEIIASVSKI